MGSLWICENGHEFTFIPKGSTRPEKCPITTWICENGHGFYLDREEKPERCPICKTKKVSLQGMCNSRNLDVKEV